MKHFSLLSILILLMISIIRAQAQMPGELQFPLKIPANEYSQPWFIYNIKPVSELKGPANSILLRTYEMGYEIGNTKKTVRISEPSLLIGFYGFKFTLVSDLNALWGKASDTTIQPCVHNLLCDVFSNTQDALEIEDLSRCKLIIMDLAKNEYLYDQIASVIPIPASTKGILYLLWNKGTYDELPAPFKGMRITQMDLLHPFKIPKNKEIVQATKAPRQTTGKKDDITEKSPSQKQKPAPVVPPVKPPAKRPETENKILPAAEVIKKPTTPVSIAPAINLALYSDFWQIAIKNNPLIKQDTDTLTLAKKNDSVIVSSKTTKQVQGVYPVTLWSIPVVFHQPGMNNENITGDPEIISLVASNIKRTIFSYKGQKLFFTEDKNCKTRGILKVPDFCNNINELKVDWFLSADMQPNAGVLSKTDSIIFQPRKSTVKLLMTDDKLNIPLDACYIDFTRGGRDPLFSIKAKSGDLTPELYISESFYFVTFYYPGYKIETTPVSRSEFETGKTIRLQSIPSYNIFYVAPDPDLKIKMINSVEEKLESVNRLKQPLLLFISNSDQPLIASDFESADVVMDRVAQLFDQPAILKTDESALTRRIRSISVPKNSKINFNVFISEKLYRSAGENFILDIYSTLKALFVTDVYVYVYIDADINNKVYSDSQGGKQKITKQFKYNNLLNE